VSDFKGIFAKPIHTHWHGSACSTTTLFKSSSSVHYIVRNMHVPFEQTTPAGGGSLAGFKFCSKCVFSRLDCRQTSVFSPASPSPIQNHPEEGQGRSKVINGVKSVNS
jgi:hypothetical protein